MKTFLQWVEDHNLELPIVTDTEDGKKDGKGAFSEKTKRSGLGYNYPPAYVMGQYMDKKLTPNAYFMANTPDATYRMTAKPKSGGANTAAN